jgi:FkbM family methyltransferase
VATLKSRLQSGDTVIDVGANIGYFSLVAARAVGEKGRVVAFEPVAEVRQALTENVRINGATVEIHDEALAETTGEVRFFRGPAQDSGLGSLRPLAAGREVTVRQVPFDDIWDRRSRVALVKIDVEGGELGVLRGMAETLARDRPHLVLEVTDDFLKALGASAAQLWSFVTSLDYEMYEIADDGKLELVPSLEALATRAWQFNALCSPRAK